MKVTFVVLLVLFAVVNGSSPFNWQKFKRDHNKHYASTAEEVERQQIFFENVNRMRYFQRTHPNATFTLAINHLADRRIEELVSPLKPNFDVVRPEDLIQLENLPDSLDWRTKGVITPVRDQGALGATNAFAAVELVESLFAIRTKKLVEGSIARVADCCPQPADPFECIHKMGGICSAGDYPTPTGQCVPNKCKTFANFDKIKRLKAGDENTMVTWIQDSPLFIELDASQISFQLYQSGIYEDSTCSKTTPDHAMQLVGYGKTTSGELYWICKNSWGVGWGERGYIRILRGKNICGIANEVVQIV